MKFKYKVYKILSLALLFILGTLFYMKGIFLSKNVSTQKSEAREIKSRHSSKVILLLVDALREDFIEFDDSITHYLNT